MALPHTGCKEVELLCISTGAFDLTINGRPSHPNANVSANVQDASQVKLQCRGAFVVDYYNPSRSEATNIEHQQGMSLTVKTEPLFFEQTNYQVIIEKKSDAAISFWHTNILIREKVIAVGKLKRTIGGVINFRNEVGYSDLEVLVDGVPYLTVQIEVFPSKIDYREDYIQLLQDVNDEIYNLAFDFLKKTFLWANINDKVGNSPTEYYSILTYIFKKFIGALDIVLKLPHHKLQQEANVVPAHKVRKSHNATVKWLEKHPHHLSKSGDQYYPTKLLHVTKRITYDTFENRFVKYILQTIVKKIRQVKDHYKLLAQSRAQDDSILKSLETMVKEVQKRLDFSFLKNVGTLHTHDSLSLVFSMAPGYRDVYKYYLMLLRGLSLHGEVFKLSMKDMAVLYEYWCFIKLNGILKRKYKMIQQELIKVDHTGLFVTLTKGQEAKVTYQNPRTGEKFSVTYNPVYKQPTVAQQPDNILSLEKLGSKIQYKYIFDAKYKVNPALVGSDYHGKYKLPGPQEEDINTMHRYRDAIVYSEREQTNFAKTMFGAFILFPHGNEEQYSDHGFYKSIEKVHVGGLPFLPSATKLVEQLLDELIEDSSESAYERSILPIGTYEYIEQMSFDQRNVLVGSLKNKEQLTINLKHNFYHIPYSKIKKKGVNFDAIALYQSDSTFKEQSGIQYYGYIQDWEVVKRSEIREVPKPSDELYVRFTISKWKKLKKPIQVKEYGIRSHVYTTMDLLHFADTLPELCMKTKEEYRLYKELKRVSDSLSIEMSAKNLDSSQVHRFQFNGALLLIQDQNIKVFHNEQNENPFVEGIPSYKELPISEFLARPTAVMGQILSFIRSKE